MKLVRAAAQLITKRPQVKGVKGVRIFSKRGDWCEHIIVPMRLNHIVTGVLLLLPATLFAQAQHETAHAIEGGGVFASGWTGKVDANAEKDGQSLKDAKLTQEGEALHVTTGPAV